MAESGVEFKDKEVQKLIARISKKAKDIDDRGKKYIGLLSSIIFRDIINHFEQEKGPDGKWVPWSQRYARYMTKIGKGGNLILSDTGRLRQGWQPTRYRTSSQGILWYNPVKYARNHNEGLGRFPKREFAWLSSNAMKQIEDQTVKFLRDN